MYGGGVLSRDPGNDSKWHFRVTRLLGLRVEDGHLHTGVMLVQLGPPGELRSTAEIAKDMEGAPLFRDAEPVSQKR